MVPPTEGRSIRHPVKQQFHTQKSSQDVKMDPRFQPPSPHYSQIQQHQQIQVPLVEVNELGPTIQQGMIQCPMGGAQSNKETRLQAQTRTSPQSERNVNINFLPDPEENERDRSQPRSGKIFPEGYQLALNEAARPVFVNHYYAGETLVSGMNKRYIRLDECDISSESVAGVQQMQGLNRKSAEHSQESPMA